MYQEINNQLEAAHQGILKFRKTEAMLVELRKQRETLKKKTEELKVILEKEDIDVEKLEGKNLSHIFYSILGNLDEHLSKERSEALAAQLKYEQAMKDLENVNAEIDRLATENHQYQFCESEYNELYDKKKELLLRSNSTEAEQILTLTSQITITRQFMKEITEALAAGDVVLHHLNLAEDSLNSAEGWGTWDLLGGGLISDLAKHSHLDEAKIEVDNIQAALSRFRTELADVRIVNTINIDTDGFGKFADFFFDGLIADWSMQSRIHDSQESVSETKRQIQSVISKLKNMENTEEDKAKQLENEIKALVDQAE